MDTSVLVKPTILIFLTVASLVVVVDSIASDPTQPFFTERASPVLSASKKLNLQAIYRRTNGMEAVINDVALKEGDHILGARINKIEKDKVYYSKSKKHGVLTLHQRFLKKARVEG